MKTLFLLPFALPSLALAADQIAFNSKRSSPFTPSLDKAIAESLERWHTPGLSIAVVDGEETYSKAFGFATLPDSPMTPEHLFYAASTTKSFTAAALSLLIDDDANSSEPLTWQTPIAKVMREDFVLPDPYVTLHATFEDALSHRTGMPGHDLTWMGANLTVRDVVRGLRHLSLSAEIRSQWQYCNIMFVTVSHLIETWTGVWLGDFLRSRIYKPLGMASTYFSLQDAQDAEAAGGNPIATGYYWHNYTNKYGAFPHMNAPQVSGAGATISNVLDYSKWLRCHMTKSAPLSDAGHEELHTPRMISSPVRDGKVGFRGTDAYAFGWDVSNYRGETMMWHTGGLPGFTTIMLYLPRLQWGLTAMANGGTGVTPLIIAFRLIDDLLGVPEEEAFNWDLGFDIRNMILLQNLKYAKEILFPNAPKGKDAIPPALPLDSYTGIYTHPSYPTFTVSLNTTSLAQGRPVLSVSPLDEQIFNMSMSLEHITGEYFLMWIRIFIDEPRETPDDLEPLFDQVTKAEFHIGQDGQVREVGIQLEGGTSETTWFQKEVKGRKGCGGGRKNNDMGPFTTTGFETFEAARGMERKATPLFQPRMNMAPLFE